MSLRVGFLQFDSKACILMDCSHFLHAFASHLNPPDLSDPNFTVNRRRNNDNIATLMIYAECRHQPSSTPYPTRTCIGLLTSSNAC